MIWILALVTTVNLTAPDVTINKVGVFTEEQKCEDTRRTLQENAESGNLYICVKHTKEK
jgi:hypothetical protein